MPETDDPRLISPQCHSLTPVQTIHENPWFVVRNRGGYYTVEYEMTPVMVLPIVDSHSILMVRVKRPVLADNTLELPSGASLEGESPVEAVARELAEETGIIIKDLDRFEPIPPISNAPNRNPKLAHFFQINLSGEDIDRSKVHDEEILSVECYKFEKITDMIADGEIYISVPVALIGRFLITHYRYGNKLFKGS
jgi:8-oxo-dGTP pyrophosphatase MutT (NUDIX family)